MAPRLTDVFFPNGGVFSVTNEMRDGALVEVATVGREGMLGIGVFLGDRSGAGRTFQQVPDGPFPSMSVGRFMKESATAGPFRDVWGCPRRPTCCRSCKARRATRCTT